MASDANLVLQAAVSRSATLSSTGVSIGGTPRRGLKARIIYGAPPSAGGSAMSGSAVVTWTVEASFDAGSNYFQVASGAKDVTNMATTTTGGEIHIPFEVSPSNPATPVLVRLITTIASVSGSGICAVYQGDIVMGRPG